METTLLEDIGFTAPYGFTKTDKAGINNDQRWYRSEHAKASMFTEFPVHRDWTKIRSKPVSAW
jgi:hypothetical protein